MTDIEGIKTFLYAWLHKNLHVTPSYTFIQRATGPGRLRFICELHVEGMDYVGIGNSTNKKNAQTNSARDFVSYLVREGRIVESLVPSVLSTEYQENEPERPEAKTSFTPTESLEFSRKDSIKSYDEGESYISRIFDQKKLEEAEEVDLTADIHGGWSMENAKSRLNEYLQVTRQQISQLKYTAVGPESNRSYIAESTVYAQRLQKSLYARETGSNKRLASRACCLSLVRQLFHAGEIEPFTGGKRKRKSEEVPITDIEIDPELEGRLDNLLDNLGLLPSLDPPIQGAEDDEVEHNMITNYSLTDFEPQPKRSAQGISWCPPISNWNPWTACNIDEGSEATMSIKQISHKLSEENHIRLQDSRCKTFLSERSSLPVFNYKRRIIETIRDNRVTLIKGETGCGKTTQIPQYLLDHFIELGRGAECSVMVTQPRRICAISLAERVAAERCEMIGTSVGYSVRFETIYPRPYGSILFCTVGTMSRKMEGGIRGVSHIIIDEIHERDVNTDFMLILVRDMITINRDLRVVLMSATIDTTTFVEYFGECAMVELEGRTHPVTYYYLEDCIQMLNYTPPPPDERKKKRKSEEETIADAEENCNLICPSEYPPNVARALKEIGEKEVPFDLIASLLDYICNMNIDGAVLIFLPGWNIISLLRKFLQTHPRYSRTDYLILPLHSQVPREDQRLVFRPVSSNIRKIVLSTNIAESSITINDVVFVIDLCLARVKLFTTRNNMTSYSTVWASKTNLEQRRGRAGRVRAGFAFHLCSRARFERLEAHATPEILLTPLHELTLMIKLLRLGDVSSFLKKAIQPPPLDVVIEAEHNLREMKALDKNDELTPLGMILARLPLEPRLGRMLVFACIFNLGGAMTLLTSHASLGSDAFIMPPDRRRLSNDQLRYSAGTQSDHLTTLNVFQVWCVERERSGESAADYFCDLKEINGPSLRVMEDAASQIRSILIGLGFPEEVLSDRPINFNNPNCPEFDYVAALLTIGLYPNIAYHTDKRKLLTAEGKAALIHKGSVTCLKENNFTFPFFTFTEKIRTQAISCKSLTMVNPLHILLFGCRRGVWKGEADNEERGVIILDDWLPVRMLYTSAARILALRPALEALLVRVCMRTSLLESLPEEDSQLLELTRDLCSRNAYSGVIAENNLRMSTNGFYRKRFAADLRHPLLSSRTRRVGTEMDTATFNNYQIGRGRGMPNQPYMNYRHEMHQRMPYAQPRGYRPYNEYVPQSYFGVRPYRFPGPRNAWHNDRDRSPMPRYPNYYEAW